jgi:uncharacterized protein (DUF1501 family)
MIPRRMFLRDGCLAALGMSVVPGFLCRAAAAVPQERRNKTLVVIFLRGAADGLNIVVPFGEKAYYTHRPTLAVPKPSKDENAAIDLDGFFGLHPRLRPILPLFKEGHLAIVNAVGSPNTGGRSHFQAQDFMESAAPGHTEVGTGWLNRYLSNTPDSAASSFRATALAPTVPKALRGPAPVLAMQDLAKFDLGGGALYESLYTQDPNTAFAGTAREMFETMKRLKTLRLEDYRPAAGVNYGPGEFGPAMLQVAQLIKAEVGLQVACVDFRGGWDTHSDESGRLPNLLRDLAQGLDAFNRDLGDRMNDVVVLTMSEFGRTARENGSGGTDHGHANFMFVMGGPVHGGKVYGKWPGLEKEQLNEDRDLALTTDYRDVLAEVVVKHLGCEKPAPIFPNYAIDPGRSVRMI